MSIKIKAVIVDDEADSREVLGKLLLKYANELEIAGYASNALDAYDIINTVEPQLVFLDIQMPRGDGFSLLKKFSYVGFEVIFVTSYDHFAINAIKFNALDYLLKPVETGFLDDAVKKAISSIEKKVSSNTQIVNLLVNLDPAVKERKFAVHNGDSVAMVNISEMLYIEADGRYCHLFINDGKKYTTAKNIGDFEEYLGAASAFVRISKSFLVNSHFVAEYSKGEPCTIELINGKVFEIPRRKKTEILEKLKELK